MEIILGPKKRKAHNSTFYNTKGWIIKYACCKNGWSTYSITYIYWFDIPNKYRTDKKNIDNN
ncbi:hypothetical protein SAMN05216364_10644 [Porphyromonadaceae bacterium KHP3R9]|nr:hypothetical protein SAMN05216364_10644 [Porphyromonadaceae bacterium KHP3R9]